MKARPVVVTTSIAVAGAVAIVAMNYFGLQRQLNQVIESDTRNSGISAHSHYRNFIIPGQIVFDLRSIDGEKSMLDVTRVLLQFSQSKKDSTYRTVTLSWRGDPKFVLQGDYFKELGEGFGTENPVYTMRTLPQHVKTLTGEEAFPTWSGGFLGVLGKQMEDLGSFHKSWYLNDLSNTD